MTTSITFHNKLNGFLPHDCGIYLCVCISFGGEKIWSHKPLLAYAMHTNDDRARQRQRARALNNNTAIYKSFSWRFFDSFSRFQQFQPI